MTFPLGQSFILWINRDKRGETMLTVSQLARICNITPKTLRYYDKIQLFSPVKIGENQYRYYEPEQMNTLRTILYYRSLGMGLEQIHNYMDLNLLEDPKKMLPILQDHLEKIQQEIKEKERLIHDVENAIQQIESENKKVGEDKIMVPKIVEKAEFKIIGMEYSSKVTEDSIPKLWSRFTPRCKEINNKVNPEQALGICFSSKNGDFTYIAGFEVDDITTVPSEMVSKTITGQTYAIFTHKGPVDTISKTMQEIYERFLKANGLEPVDAPDFELYDHRFISPNHEESELDLYIPIK